MAFGVVTADIPGIVPPSGTNRYNSQTYPLKSPAPASMPTEPGHEFRDVLEQLRGAGHEYRPGQPYPVVGNSGFVSNYATTKSELTKHNPRLPTSAEYGDIMQCFDTKKDLDPSTQHTE